MFHYNLIETQSTNKAVKSILLWQMHGWRRKHWKPSYFQTEHSQWYWETVSKLLNETVQFTTNFLVTFGLHPLTFSFTRQEYEMNRNPTFFSNFCTKVIILFYKLRSSLIIWNFYIVILKQHYSNIRTNFVFLSFLFLIKHVLMLTWP